MKKVTKKKKENIIKDVRNTFGLTKEIDGSIIKSKRNPFKPKKEKKAIIIDIGNLFEKEEEYYYKYVREGNSSSNN